MSGSEDEDEAAAALEARRSTLEHLSPEEAAQMLTRIPAPQAAQLVLLMGSERRSAVAAMSAAQRAAIGAAMAQDTAEALGLLEGAPAEAGTFDPPAREPASEEGEAAGPVACAERANESGGPATMPETAEPEQPAVTESCEAGPKSKEQVEEAGKEVEKAGKAEKVAAEQVSEEKLSEQLAETLPEKLDEVKPGFGDRVGEADEALDIGEGERKVEEEKAQEDMAGKASEREPELVEASAQDGGDIVDTWLINDKPAVREQFAVPVSVHRPVRDDNFDRDVAQVAFHLSPLPNTTVVGYLEGLPAEECDAVLSHFDPERRRELLELLTEELRGTSSSSSSAKMLPPRVSQFGGRALGLAGTLAALAKQGISEMAPEASQAASKGAGTAALEMKRAAAAASHAAGWASSQARQSVDRAAHTKSAEYAKTAASSALSAAKVGVSSAAHQAEAVAGAARHSVTHMVNTSPAAGSSARLARQVTTDAKQKVAGAAEVAKEGLASVSKGMASFFKNR